MGIITCSACGAKNDSKKYFCHNCGKLIVDFSFANDSVADTSKEMESKLATIASTLKNNPHIDILWNDTVDAYTRKIEKIQSLLKNKDLGIESAELTDKINRFLHLCRKPDFEIAFVGAVKAGKSTLINALLGRTYASTDPNPETAVLTKFRSSEQDYINVKFYTEAEWNRLWKSVQSNAEKFLELYKELKANTEKDKWVGHDDNHIVLKNDEIEDELKKWSSSQSAAHFFVKEIEVGISSLPREIPKQVVFVDTPGLFDPVEFRSQISVDYIHKANAVLVCVKAEDLHGEEVKTVESVFSFSGHKRDKVFVIATNWDKLNNVVIDWNKRYKYMVDSFTGKAFFPTKELARKNILYAASYHYNLCRDYKQLKNSQKNKLNIWVLDLQNHIEECESEGLTVPKYMDGVSNINIGMLSRSDLEKLMKITNIQKINSVIVKELVNQYKELLYEDIKNLYDDVLHMTVRVAGDRKQTIDDRIKISNSDIQEIEMKVKETIKNKNEIQKVQQQLISAMNSVNKSTQKRLEAITSQLEW